MSEKTICTECQLDEYLKSKVSVQRYNHSVGVASTMKCILDNYGYGDCTKKAGNFTAYGWCGLSHDIAREFTDEEILEFCRKHNIHPDKEFTAFPVLSHGIVSSAISSDLCCTEIPESWKNALIYHTTGDSGLDRVGMALFASDFIEPTRTFLTEDDRKRYYASDTLERLCYTILVDMMNHWQKNIGIKPSVHSVEFLKKLEERLN